MFDDIKEQFKKVITFSQGIENPQVDELFNNWYAAKKDFINLFGGKLIVESQHPIRFELDARAKAQKVEAFSEVVYDVYHNPELSSFIDDNVEGFYDNKVSTSCEIDGVYIPEGMKLVKAFKHFEKDKSTLNEIQMRASEIIQQDKIEGKLCFSVHPLDFLSTSQNTYNWRSCHSLDGDYRAGNLSYMVDSCTFICYLKGENDIQIPLFPADVPWNSKKWRCLMFAAKDGDLIFAGRQYPFESKSGISQALAFLSDTIFTKSFRTDWLSPIISSYYDTFNNRTVELAHSYCALRGKVYNLEDVIVDNCPVPLYFNDLLRSSCYQPICSFDTWSYGDYTGAIQIGGKVKCLDCGKEFLTESSSMRCEDCELKNGTEENDTYTFCDCCGARILRDDGYSISLDGYHQYDTVCDSCYKEHCFTCEDCGDDYYDTDKHWNPELEEYVCKYCYGG